MKKKQSLIVKVETYILNYPRNQGVHKKAYCFSVWDALFPFNPRNSICFHSV